MKKSMIDNLMSYVENGTDKGQQMDLTNMEIKNNTIHFEGEVKQLKNDGYTSDDRCDIKGRVKYITKDLSTIVAIDVDYDGIKNGEDYKYGEIISFEQIKGEKENVVLKTVLNKQTQEIKETYYRNYDKDIDLSKNYIHNCYDSVPYHYGEYLVEKNSKVKVK